MLDFWVMSLPIEIETRNVVVAKEFISEIRQNSRYVVTISKLDDSIEHLWVEIQEKKKNSTCLIGVFYQPSSENNKKLEWIEKLDSVLSIVKSTWNGNIMITGNSNIDLLASTEIQKR